MQRYSKLIVSDMATEDLTVLLAELESVKLESLHTCLASLDGMSAAIGVDIPRDGRNFAWRALGMNGGLIDHGTDYSLHS